MFETPAESERPPSVVAVRETDWLAPSVPSVTGAGHPPTIADSKAVGTALCALLRLAESADAHNSPIVKRLSLQAYVLLVRAQTGRTLTTAEAATLIALSAAL